MVRCLECGLIYLNPTLVAVEIENLYSKEYFFKWYHTEKKRQFSKTFFRQLLRKHQLKSEIGQKILDLGCGMGFFLEVAREWRSDVRGLDISSHAAAYCKEKFNFDVHCGSFETANYHSNTFDMITAFDFFEHINGLADCLSVVRRILKPTGKFIILVPNYHSLVFQFERNICRLKKAPLSNVPEHLIYFTIPTLKQVFQKNGFTLQNAWTTHANDDGAYLRVTGSPKAIIRTLFNRFCFLIGKMCNKREMILAVAKKTTD